MRHATLGTYDHRCAAILANGERCGVAAPLEVHHVDGDPSNDLPSNRVPLCVPHHRALTRDPGDSMRFAPPNTPFVA
jgi:hypothetical protein